MCVCVCVVCDVCVCVWFVMCVCVWFVMCVCGVCVCVCGLWSGVCVGCGVCACVWVFCGVCVWRVRASLIYSQSSTNEMQRFSNFFISVRSSTCFRRFFRPSSGAQNCTYSVRYLSDRYCYLLLAWPAPS